MLQQKFWHFLHGRIGSPKSYERYFYIFISAMCTFTHKTTDIGHPSFSWLGTGIFTWRKVRLSKVLYMKMLRKRCLKTNFCPGKSLKSRWFCSTKKCMNPDGPKVFLSTKIKPEYSNILYNLTHFPGPLVCQIRQVPL